MRVFLCGATGFVGRHVLDALLAAGHKVVALVRDPAALADVQGPVEVVKGDLAVPLTFRGRAMGCGASINAVGLIRERGRQTYDRIVVNGTENWAKECRESNVRHLVLVSANGADPEGTQYQKTKWLAERTVRNSGLPWTILRPSLIFGPPGVGSDNFAARLAGLLKLRVVPVFGRQDYYLEPVSVRDVARIVEASLREPQAKNRVFHLGGPEQFTYREMLEVLREATGRRAWLVPAPRFAAYAAGFLFGWLPFFPATLENFRMLFAGNVCPEHDWTGVFGIEPEAFSKAAPVDLAPLRRG